MCSLDSIPHSKCCYTVVIALSQHLKEITSYLLSFDLDAAIKLCFLLTSEQKVHFGANQSHTASRDIYIYLADKLQKSEFNHDDTTKKNKVVYKYIDFIKYVKLR